MYVLAAILALAVILQAAVAVIDSVLDLVKLKDLVHKIPVIGAHWSLGISMLMVWVFEAEPLGGWGIGHTEHWHHIVLNGAVVWGAIPLKDAVVNMVNKGLRA
jgi:hypothetical protein